MSGNLGAGLLGSLGDPLFCCCQAGVGRREEVGCCKRAWDLRRGGPKGKPAGVRTGGLGTNCIYSLCLIVPSSACFMKLPMGTTPKSGDLSASG